MNELAMAVSLSFGFTQNYRIIDRKGAPWFAAKDVCQILGIKKDGHTFDNFPESEKKRKNCLLSMKRAFSGLF